jgi:hypothetical protein
MQQPTTGNASADKPLSVAPVQTKKQEQHIITPQKHVEDIHFAARQQPAVLNTQPLPKLRKDAVLGANLNHRILALSDEEFRLTDVDQVRDGYGVAGRNNICADDVLVR